MNSILNYGFVSPYILFTFLGSGDTLDTIPPRYFASFHQDRSVDQACSFTLTLVYAPGYFNEDTATIIDKLLLSQVKHDVTYRYGYKTRHGGLTMQNQYYAGIFTTYNSEINEGYLTYTISGISHSVELVSPSVCVSDYITNLKDNVKEIQPSIVVYNLVKGNGPLAAKTGIAEYFRNYEIEIDQIDEKVSTKSINIQDGPLHDVFFGKANSDKTSLPSGLVSLSYVNDTSSNALSSDLLSERDIQKITEYEIRNTYNSSGITQDQYDTLYAEPLEKLKNLKKIPFVCYYDNVVSSEGSTSKGSFHYIPKYTRAITNVYNYSIGNSVIDSDVLSFSASVDCTPALATIPSIKDVSVDIDVDGEAIGNNYNSMQSDGFVRNTYNTPSGFNEAAWLTTSTIANALNFPFEATMTIIGQIDANKLLDTILVNIFVNGVPHEGFSGKYTVLGIEDDLSENGFTTTLKLSKQGWAVDNDKVSDYVSNYSTNSRAWHNEQAMLNDYK